MNKDREVAVLEQQVMHLRARVLELEQQEGELEEELGRFRLIAEGVQDLISVRDAGGAIEYNDPAHARVFGSLETLQDADMFGPIHPMDRPKIEALFLETVRSGVGQAAQFRVLARDNNVLVLQSRGNPILDAAGKVTKVIAVSHDITDLTATSKELEERNRVFEELNKLAVPLYQSPDKERMLSDFVEAVPAILPHTSGAAYLFKHSAGQYEPVMRWGEPVGEQTAFKKADCRAARLDSAYQNDGIGKGEVCDHLPPDIGRAYLCTHTSVGREDTRLLFHVQYHDEAIAGKRADERTRWNKSQSQLAVTIANLLASSIDAHQLTRRLQTQAITDQLTGLYNRGHMDETLKREVSRQGRKKDTQKETLGVVLIDIDFFKRINDRSGHPAGDQVLQTLAAFLRKHVRDTDILGRYGGEEFMLMMVDSTREGIRDRAEQLRRGVKEIEIISDGKPLRKVTLSVGVAFFPDHGNTVEQLVEAADKALYRSKEQGRDQVVVLGTPKRLEQIGSSRG